MERMIRRRPNETLPNDQDLAAAGSIIESQKTKYLARKAV